MECAFFFLGHLSLGLGCLVALTGQMECAVDDDTVELVQKRNAELLSIGTNGIERDEYIAVER